MNIVLIGQPGSGKGTQAEQIVHKYKMHKISAGDLLRARMKMDDEIAVNINNIVSQGKLVGDDIILKLIQSEVQQNIKNCEGFIFDGFPRNAKQSEMLELLLDEFELSLDAVILIDVSKDMVIERLSGRYMCADCGAIYHKEFLKPKHEGVCDSCGSSHFITRKDDNKEVLEKRFDSYASETKPLIDYYHKHGILHVVDGEADVPVVAQNIDKILNSFVL